MANNIMGYCPDKESGASVAVTSRVLVNWMGFYDKVELDVKGSLGSNL